MTPSEAHRLITQVAEACRATLQEHKALQLALTILKPKEELKDNPKE